MSKTCHTVSMCTTPPYNTAVAVVKHRCLLDIMYVYIRSSHVLEVTLLDKKNMKTNVYSDRNVYCKVK